jgi:YidC/Oxa1 family membrane protein insertase
VLNWLYDAVGSVLVFFHSILTGIGLGTDSGVTWGLSIVLLVVAMRLLLFPLFVKQVKSQRAMQVLQPKIKALQQKHKGDRETLNREMMALYKEHGANPLSGCLPIVLQLPIFFALFQVLNSLRPSDVVDGEPVFTAGRGIPQDLVESAGQAEFFGSRISASFTSSAEIISALDASVTATRVAAVVMIVLMGLTTFITQKQLIARAGSVDPQQQMIQKFLLYVMPFSFAIFGFSFPLGVLLYWLTTNIWSMGQQQWVIRRMPAASGGTGPDTEASSSPSPARSGSKPVPTGERPAAAAGSRVQAPAGTTGPGGTSTAAPRGSVVVEGGSGTARPKSGPGSGASRAKRRKGGRGGRR